MNRLPRFFVASIVLFMAPMIFAQKSDLTVTNVTPLAVNVGDRVVFSATVSNNTTVKVPAGRVIRLNFQIDAQVVTYSRNYSGGIAPGRSVVLTASGGPAGVNYWIAQGTSHRLLATVDPNRAFAEADETNNTLSTSIQVAAATATNFGPGSKGFSIGGHGYESMSDAELNSRLTDMKSMGVKIVRLDVGWNWIQAGGPSSYDWGTMDRVMNAVKANGLTFLGVIATTPAWARSSGDYWAAPNNPDDYGRFAGAVASHYGPMGFHHWEIWNEPNIVPFFRSGPNVAKYTSMLISAYRAIKAADPKAFVVSGGMSPAGDEDGNIAPLTFLRGIYANGGQGFFDALGHHPYTYPVFPSVIAPWSAWSQMSEVSPSLRSIMTDNGDSAKKIWMTEFGAPTAGGSKAVSEQDQAAMIGEAYTKARSYPWAGPLIIHTYRDKSTDMSDPENFYGMRRFDNSIKPSYTTYKNQP